MSVVHFACDTVAQLRSTLARLSIYSEDPDYQGTVISWEKAVSRRPYEYVGHNMGDDTVIQFFQQAYASLNESESQLLRDLESQGLLQAYYDKKKRQHIVQKTKTRFYLIGYLHNDKSTQDHELSHAYFSLSSSYAALVQELYTNVQGATKRKLDQCLMTRGYPPSIFADEFGAYILENDKEIVKLGAGANRSQLTACFSRCAVANIRINA